MSSSSTTGRPFAGRLRSSARPGCAQPSNPSACSVPSATKAHGDSTDPSTSTRFSASRSSAAGLGSHPGDERGSASARGTGCTFATAAHPPSGSRVTTERQASVAPTAEVICSSNHNGSVGGTASRSLRATGHVSTDATESAPEDKRAARRRRRAEAAAAAEAAALSGQKEDETCGLSRGASTNEAPAAATQRGHGHRSAGRGRSGMDWKADVEPAETNRRKLPSVPSMPSGCTDSGGSTDQPRPAPEPSTSISDGTSPHSAEARGGDLQGCCRGVELEHPTTPVVPNASDPTDRRSVQAAQGGDVSTQRSSEAADAVRANSEAGALSIAVSAPRGADPARSASNERSVTTERGISVSGGSHAVPNSAEAGCSAGTDGAVGGEHGPSSADISSCGPGSAGAVESSPSGGSPFTSVPESCTGGNRPFSCHPKGEKQNELNTLSASSHRSSGAESGTTTCHAKISVDSCPANSTANCACPDSAKEREISSSVTYSSVAGEAKASGCPPVPLSAVDSVLPLRHAQEYCSAGQMASGISVRYVQNASSSGDEVQHDVDEPVSVPDTPLQSSTNNEEAEQPRNGGLPVAADESTALLSDTPVIAAEEASVACSPTSELHLTPVLNGLQCLRGELLLNREEFEALQSFLRPLFYRFVPCSSANDCLSGFHDHLNRVHYTCGEFGHQASVGCSPVPPRKEGKPSSRRLKQELQALQQAACAFVALPPRGSKRRREAKLKNFQDDEAEVGSATYSSSHSSGGSFCSIGTHRRDPEGVGEDGEGSKRGDSLPVQEAGGRRQQQRTRKLTQRVDENTEGEEGTGDTIRGNRRSQRVGVSAVEAFEHVASADSDGDVSSAVSGPSRRRIRGTSSTSWKRRKSIEEACEDHSLSTKQQSLYGERQGGRGSAAWEGRGGKDSYIDIEVCVGTGNTRGLAGRRGDSKAHGRRCLPEENGCEGLHRLKRNEYDGSAEESGTRMHGSRRLWDNKQKKRAAGTVPLSTSCGENGTGSTFDGGAHVSTTASFSSPLLPVSSSTDWRENCYLIIQHLKRQPSARWFLSQKRDAASGYGDPSTQHLSLHEIEQKLTSLTFSPKVSEAVSTPQNTMAVSTTARGRGYVHPSQWQQEVRQIFFNAFTFHPVYHEIWRDAAILAAEFERCCRLVHEVNPYYPALLKHQRSSSRASAPGAAGHSTGPAYVSGVSGVPTGTTTNNFSQLPVSYMTYGGPPFDAAAEAAEGRFNVGGNHFFSGTGVAPHPHERVSLVRSQQRQLSQSDPSGFCHQRSALLASSSPGAAAAPMVPTGAFYEGTGALGYVPGAPFLRGGCGKQQGNNRTGRAGGDGGVRGKRQPQPQHEAGASEGRGESEDVGVVRKLDGSLVYAYGGQYRELRGGMLGEEGGKSRVIVTAAAGSPRRGGRGGGRGRGTTRGGRGSASANELHGSAAHQQLGGRHGWASIGGHASQGTGMVPEHGFLGPLGDIQQQAFTSGGRMLPIGIGTGGQRTNDGGMMLMGPAGVRGGTGFSAGATIPGTGTSANMLLLSSSNVLEAVQQMEAPVGAPVLPPPPVPRIGVNDKPLSSSQRRTLEQNMQRLSPMQRKAALELIQDDLGILAAEYMNVKAFAFDTELLSIEKQKRLFAYVNSMFRANREILLRQHQQQVAAAQATAVSVAADGAGDAQQQQSRVIRRGRRKRGEELMAGGTRGAQMRTGSSSSSSGSDSDSSSSLSSSDSSSSTSSSDTEEEESEGSENESDCCQKAPSSAFHAASCVAHPASVSGLNTENGGLSSTDTDRVRTGTAAGPPDRRTALGGREQLSVKTLESGLGGLNAGGGEERGSGSRWPNDSVGRNAHEQNCSTSEVRTSSDVTEGMVGSVLHGKNDVSESSGSVAPQQVAGVESAILAGSARQTSDSFERPGEEGRFCSSSPVALSSSGDCVSRGNNQGQDCHGPPWFQSARADSPLESGAGLSPCESTPAYASSHAISAKRPGAHAACSAGGDEAEITEGDKNATEGDHRTTGRFLGSCGAAAPTKTSGSGGRTLPQYTPVCEEGARVEIRAEVMGRHADFLGMLAVREAGGSSENEGSRIGDCGAKPTAWQEWKGQVIQQGFVAQRAYASQQQRSVSEIIAEGYNARI